MGDLKQKKTHTIHDISFNTVKTIKVLIKFKNMYEARLDNKRFSEICGIENVDDLGDYEAITDIYLDLDMLINSSSLNNKEKQIINYLMLGYSELEISKLKNCTPFSIYKTIEIACEALRKENIKHQTKHC